MRFSWDPIYGSTSIGTILTVLVLVLLFTVTPSGINRSRYWSLIALRVTAAIALLLTMMRPALISTDNRPTASTLVVAIDQSRSMTLASGESPGTSRPPGSTGNADTRWDQQLRVLKSLSDRFDSIDESLDLSLVSYDENAAPQASGPANEMSIWLQRLGDQLPDGNLTDLSAPLRSATNASSTNPLAGIVLMSDGTQTAYQNKDSRNAISPTAAADLIGTIGVPLWTVALGPSTQGATTRDVAITALPETYRMFSGNETEISFTVDARGYANKAISIALTWVNPKGETTPAATRTVTPNSNEESTPMRIPLVAPAPGRYQLVAQANPPAGETDATNNRQIAFVRVQSGGGRILYIEGTPRLEQMFLRRSVRRFPDMELTYRWIPRDTSKRWPIDLAGDLQPGRFDIIILGDLHSAALGKKQLEQIAESVAEGTALVTLGGERAYGPGGYGDSPLAQVLPIRMDASAVQPAGTVFIRRVADAKPTPLPGQVSNPTALIPKRNHPITTITTTTTNWSTLPDTLGANRWLGAKTAPGVQVLLDDEQKQPMLVVGEFGRGRVASLAFDSTWTWWRGGASEFHRRFWRQLMLWLLSREDTNETDIQIEMTQRRFLASEGSEFTASLASAANKPPIKLVAEIRTEQGEFSSIPTNTATQTIGEQTTSRLSGSTADTLPPGIHTLQVRTEGLSPELSETITFQITDDTRELTATLTDHSQLQRLAGATAASGGQSFRADQVDELFDRIAERQRRAERVVIDKYRLGDDPTSGWILFALFAGALSTEWYLRRKWGLA